MSDEMELRISIRDVGILVAIVLAGLALGLVYSSRVPALSYASALEAVNENLGVQNRQLQTQMQAAQTSLQGIADMTNDFAYAAENIDNPERDPERPSLAEALARWKEQLAAWSSQ